MGSRHLGAMWVGLALLAGTLRSPGFVLMGPPNLNETVAFNYVDDLGAPKEIDRQTKRFFRWNIPSFVYSFDASFVGYFGVEGMDAVHEAFNVLNNFFVNEDYKGMSALDLSKHGYVGNYNTTWVNTTAQNSQVIDIKSVVLGLMVNHLGLGNPHRHAFSITGLTTNSTGSSLNFHVRLRNYDPVSGQATDTINNVKYSYRLIHDLQTIDISAVAQPTTVDMEEFTGDQSGNAFTSVAAIADAFYGGTSLFWTDTPTVFNFGVYYDGFNAMGGQFSPRHALTYDDAGGLKYLYSTNNIIWDHTLFSATGGSVSGIMLIEPSQVVPDYAAVYLSNQPRTRPFFPRQGGLSAGALPAAAPITTPFRGWSGMPDTSGLINGATLRGIAERGGLDKLQFHHQPFDSLIGNLFTATNFVWDDIFLSTPNVEFGTNNLGNVINISDANGRQIGTINEKAPGIQWLVPNADTKGATFWLQPEFEKRFQKQKVGRTVTAPDILFTCEDLGTSPDGVPIGWLRPTNNAIDLSTLNPGGGAWIRDPNAVGPGIFVVTNSPVIFQFTRAADDFEVLWSGEASVVGNLAKLPSLWGHIKGPGPNDVVTFPRGNTQARVENSIIPDTSVPSITLVSDSAGAAPIEASTLTRTEEVLTIVGSEMASVSAIDIMSGDLVVQTIFPVDKYIVSNSRIDVPAGAISDASEGTERQVRVWNSVGASVKSTQKFKIETGRPVITSTDADGQAFDRAQTLTVRGYGFKSKTALETLVALIRVDDSTGAAKFDAGSALSYMDISTGVPHPVTGIEVLSDTQLVLPINAISNLRADGPNRRLRVARKTAIAANVDSVLSPATNPLFLAVATKPVITTLMQKTDTTWEDVVGTSPTGLPGETWTARDASRTWRSVASSADGTKLVAVVENGQIYTSTDSGITWTAREANRDWIGVASSADGTKLVATVEGGQIYTSTDSGVTWTPRENNRNWRNVASSSDGTKLVAVEITGQIYTSTDSGVNWTARENNRSWTGVASSADGTKLVATVWTGQVYTSIDSGVTWTARESSQQWWDVASSADGTKLVAVVENGQIYTSTDSGVSWTPRENNRVWRRLASSADGTKLIAVVALGRIYTSTDSGVTWVARENNRNFFGAASSADGTKLVATVWAGQIYTSSGLFAVATGMFKRDKILEINGTGLNTLTTIEVVQQDGTSFANPIFIQLPNAAVTVEENGTRIQMAASAFTASDADTNSTTKRAFKLYNAVGYTDLSANLQFAVNTQPVVDAIGGFASAGYFNRDKTLGDDLVIFGSGFKAVNTITLRSDTASASLLDIVLPSPGVTVTDTQIAVDTQQFQIGAGADTSAAQGTRRIVALVSARDTANSPLAQRFYVGAPPTLNADPISAGLAGDNYKRTTGVLTVDGTGLGHLTTIEIVDINGNTIAGLPGLTATTGATVISTVQLTVATDAAGWALSTHLLDSVVANSRRVRVTTPFGKVTSNATAADGAFTISASPVLLATVQATFAGGGFSGGTTTYDKSEGDLFINGSNFRGVNKIELVDSLGAVIVGVAAFDVDPSNPPAGVSFSADGTRIIIDDAVIPAAWNGANRKVKLTSADTGTVLSTAISTVQD